MQTQKLFANSALILGDNLQNKLKGGTNREEQISRQRAIDLINNR